VTAPATFALPHVAVALCHGVVYRETDERLWNALIKHSLAVRDYFAVLGLTVIVDDSEGYAYLASIQYDEDAAGAPKRLVPRSRLGFQVSLLLVLLRKRLAEFDASGASAVLVMTREDIVDMIRMFLPATTNEVALVNKVDSYIGRAVDLGFLKPVNGQEPAWRVQRILKAFVDAQWLADFDARLSEYLATAVGADRTVGDSQ
jgi:hypothetical protein